MTTAEAIVLSCVGGRYRVWLEGEVLFATMRGRMKQGGEQKILVGDSVSVKSHPDATTTIEAVLPRRSLLQRRSPGKNSGTRPVAANLDQVIVVGAARQPDWDPQLMDRFIAVAEASGLPAAVVMNKADLAPERTGLLHIYRNAGYPTLITSVTERAGVDDLQALLAGKVSLFTGPSGVGKSSLLNLLQPGLQLRTGTVSPRAGSGRHTTVAAEMHPVPGGFVVDTPGLRDIGLWGLSPSDVSGAFPDVSRIAAGCHFDNCRHSSEPGCAVIKAVEAGSLSESRLSSFRRLLEEAGTAARPWT